MPAPGDRRRTDSGDRRERAYLPLRVTPLTVSLAVFLVDGPTGGSPDELPGVSLQGIDAESKRKSDRYRLFLDVDLPEPPAPTVVSVDGGDRYRDVTREVVVTGRDDLEVPAAVEVYPPSNPTVPVRLFSADATVVRGYVRDTDENRIAGAELRVTDFDLAAETDANGRFDLYFPEGPDDGDVDAELHLEALEDPVAVTIPVADGEETTRTFVVDVADGAVSVHDGII